MATGTKTVEINVENPNIYNDESNSNTKQKGKGIFLFTLGTVVFELLNRIKNSCGK